MFKRLMAVGFIILVLCTGVVSAGYSKSNVEINANVVNESSTSARLLGYKISVNYVDGGYRVGTDLISYGNVSSFKKSVVFPVEISGDISNGTGMDVSLMPYGNTIRFYFFNSSAVSVKIDGVFARYYNIDVGLNQNVILQSDGVSHTLRFVSRGNYSDFDDLDALRRALLGSNETLLQMMNWQNKELKTFLFESVIPSVKQMDDLKVDINRVRVERDNLQNEKEALNTTLSGELVKHRVQIEHYDRTVKDRDKTISDQETQVLGTFIMGALAWILLGVILMAERFSSRSILDRFVRKKKTEDLPYDGDVVAPVKERIVRVNGYKVRVKRNGRNE